MGYWNPGARAHSRGEFADREKPAVLFSAKTGNGEGQFLCFPSKNARRKNLRKFLRRNGQRGYSGIPPEY
jgi:hypothetical protein